MPWSSRRIFLPAIRRFEPDLRCGLGGAGCGRSTTALRLDAPSPPDDFGVLTGMPAWRRGPGALASPLEGGLRQVARRSHRVDLRLHSTEQRFTPGRAAHQSARGGRIPAPDHTRSRLTGIRFDHLQDPRGWGEPPCLPHPKTLAPVILLVIALVAAVPAGPPSRPTPGEPRSRSRDEHGERYRLASS